MRDSKCKETVLNEDERIVGYKSRMFSEAHKAAHNDFQFILGR